MPLLGSQGVAAPSGVGGPVTDPPFALSSTQDNALVSSKNPTGILPLSYPDQIVVYTVVEGDAPSSIAESFGISLNTLLWANNLTNPNLIKVGSTLVILPVTGVKYEVRAGDTLQSIAKKFKGEVEDIRAFNGLAVGEELQAGRIIIIPDGEIASLVVASPASRSSISRLPEFVGYFMRPILGGRKSRGIHGYNGVDLANSCGLPILASAAGTIIVARDAGWNGGYGKYLVVSHPNGTQTLYAHLNAVLAKYGQQVAQGSQIGKIGSTGNSTGCHLHFEVRGARNPF